LTVNAKFSNGSISITATLFFNENGEILNFLSNDRFEISDDKNYLNYPWITPVTDYANINGYHLASSAKLIYKHPDEDLCYGEFNLKSIEYNCKEFK